MNLTAEQICQAIGGTFVTGNPSQLVTSISKDTRTIQKGDLYWCLVGKNLDGHRFVSQAIELGAAGVVVSTNCGPVPESVFVIQVLDTQQALLKLAHFWRNQFSIPVVGLTGSSGKTTTKDMVAECLAESGSVCKTQGNLNNLIGMPFSVFNLDPSHRFAVIEMGMNAFGEIDAMASSLQPDVGLITNVGHAHLEGVGGNLTGVARAKAEILPHIRPDGVAVLNADQKEMRGMKPAVPVIWFGFDPDAQYRCTHFEVDEQNMDVHVQGPDVTHIIRVQFFGEHMIYNMLAAIAVARHLEVSWEKIIHALGAFKAPSMRGEHLVLGSGLEVISDVYNANPDSMEAALMAFKLRFESRERFAALGQMRELGPQSAQLHEWVGRQAARNGIKKLFVWGEDAQSMVEGYLSENGEWACVYPDLSVMAEDLKQHITGREALLVKGSRGSQMEKVLQALGGR